MCLNPVFSPDISKMHKRRLLKTCAEFPLRSLHFFPYPFTLSSPLHVPLPYFIPTSSSGYDLKLINGRSPGAKRHLVHFGLKNVLLMAANFCAVHDIIASVHKISSVSMEEFAKQRHLLSIHNNFPHVKAPKHPRSRVYGKMLYSTNCPMI